MATSFEKALDFTLKFEGGYVNDPDDPGGETNRGVTKAVYDDYRKGKGLAVQSVRHITEAEIEDIYRTRYWDASQCDQMRWPLNAVVFDAAVNAGVGQARKLLQRALGVADDGKWGKGTAAAVALCAPVTVARKCNEEREEFYRGLVAKRPVLGKFLDGWLNRLTALQAVVDHAANLVTVEVNGKPLDTPGQVIDGTTYVPLRDIAETLGLNVKWDPRTRRASLSTKGGK